jgi:RNA polymerase sigma-70 factor (ECF subfamily)
MIPSAQVLRSRVALLTLTDDERVEQWVRDHAGLVFRVAYSVLRDHHDAEDATQETFIRVLRRRAELISIREPRAWLARIAFRIALNRSKSRRTQAQDSADILLQVAATGSAAEDVVHHSEVMALMETLIAALPADLRDVLRLSTVDELTSREIAAILEIPESSVRTRLHRARQLLKERIGMRLGKSHA